MQVIKTGKDSVRQIVEVLKSGGLAIFLSGVCYNAGVDATNPLAVKKLVKYKNRPFGKPFSIGTTNLAMAQKYALMNSTAINLYKTLYPGPVTLVCKGKHEVADGIESETGTIGLFVTDHKLTLEIVKTLGKPVTTSSANVSYKPRPFSVDALFKNLSQKQKDLIDLVVDSGPVSEREASTVIDTTIDDLPVLRLGEIKLKDKNEVLSRSEENTQNLAKELWHKYQGYAGKRAIIYALEGAMGAGKTQFVKGLAKAMQVKEIVTSPSYDLINTYGSLSHIDTWRMIDPNEELKSLDLKNLITDKSIVAIEWADRAINEIRKYREDAIIVWVKLNYGENESDRLISWGNL